MESNLIAFDKAQLIIRYLNKKISDREGVELADWLAANEHNCKILEDLKNEEKLEKELLFFSSVDTSKAWEDLAIKINKQNPVIPLKKKSVVLSYAAVLAIMLVSGVYFMTRITKKSDSQTAIITSLKESELIPNKDKAILTLADGSVLLLQDLKNGVIQEKDGITITKRGNKILFKITEIPKLAYHTVSTPVGGECQLVLPDGSEVWLNSATSLVFSTAYNFANRNIVLNGEAYFEVAKNTDMPFQVKAGKATVEVLGTHFNVMAYANEPEVKATLLEGSVKVRTGDKSRIIVPGQQARITDQIAMETVNAEEVIAWKNGIFQFNNAELGTALRQLERWYDVEIVCDTAASGQRFTGVISRKTDIKTILKMLNLSGTINYKIEERRIIVNIKNNF